MTHACALRLQAGDIIRTQEGNHGIVRVVTEDGIMMRWDAKRDTDTFVSWEHTTDLVGPLNRDVYDYRRQQPAEPAFQKDAQDALEAAIAQVGTAYEKLRAAENRATGTDYIPLVRANDEAHAALLAVIRARDIVRQLRQRD